MSTHTTTPTGHSAPLPSYRDGDAAATTDADGTADADSMDCGTAGMHGMDSMDGMDGMDDRLGTVEGADAR